MKLSKLAQSIQISPILQFATEVSLRQSQGELLYNLTIGDFDAEIFPIPDALKQYTIQAYHDNQTNYPGAFGMLELRQGVADLLARTCSVQFGADQIQIASGSRPLLYAAYRVILDSGDKIVYPVPSWNNDHYSSLLGAEAIEVETSVENDFMPTAEQLAPHIREASLLALCSPQNPTGTVFSRENLMRICNLVLAENNRRSGDQKPLYVLFDQVYWLLTFGATEFHHPLQLCPELSDYAVFVDGLSKSLAGTGIRVGWGTGPTAIISRMRSLIAHIGAWAPKPEQVGAGAFLSDPALLDTYLDHFRVEISARLDSFYDGFMRLKQAGYKVDAIKPQAAIYLTIKIDLIGKTTATGQLLDSEQLVHQYILNQAGIAILPFSWFGAVNHGCWYRLSIGTCRTEQIPVIMASLETALRRLS